MYLVIIYGNSFFDIKDLDYAQYETYRLNSEDYLKFNIPMEILKIPKLLWPGKLIPKNN